MKPYMLEVHEDGLAVFTINRPEKRNAISYEIMDGLGEALAAAEEDQIKALVITGAGDKAFCSGGDLSSFHQLKTEEEAFEMLNRMSELLVRLFFLPKPTIALLNGIAVGGGCELASACDFRLARKEVNAGFIQGTLAITTGWGGGTFLSERVTSSNAMKMLMEACLYNSDELKDMGFIQSVYTGDPIESCRTFLNKMLVLEGDVLKSYKGMFIRKWKEAGVEERVKQEVRNCAVLWQGEAHHKQVDKFLKK
ncbi:enoyl-CoA hydratase/isomerase family protein [Cytobacillus praedii]|uniref:Ethylmalonyl-CoA decarboxylase n=1 Tax=Cytobacillus praedii TaxID=1742358 RepID=A0A4R1B6R5_9BACI|nr:enoyl-CoA hydratase/isomerase family protein [Cytobacillus praedii]TCJ06092.1 enoyl-CoA hydratase/isomerase family protein [Cytobacillus praedii]